MKKILIPVDYLVVAVSQCEEIEGSQIVGKFPTELKALQFQVWNKDNYWELKIQKICSRCEESLEECQCPACHCCR